MRFQWKLFPLQRKLEWDLDLAQGRLGTLLRGEQHALAVLRALEGQRAEQAAHANAGARMKADPALHAQALAFLCALEAHIAQARAQQQRLQRDTAAARAECLRCQQRLDTVDSIREQALAVHQQAQRRSEGKEADAAWLARRVSQAAFPGECG
jgi:flagellar export protein FliJ